MRKPSSSVLVVALIATGACQPALPAGTAPSAPSVVPGASPSAAASASPAPPPNPTPSPVVSQAELVCYSSLPPWTPPPWPLPAILYLVPHGTVYDEVGMPVAGATVMVRSLEPSLPYVQHVAPTCADGFWRTYLVPAGHYYEVVASRPGWATRRRVGVLDRRADGRKNVIDFGAGRDGRPTDDDADATAYFLTARPELTLVEPGMEATDVVPATIALKLRVSEPLDASAQAALAEAVALVPADANGGGDEAYTFRATSSFLGAQRATTRWNPAGTELDMRFDAPLRTGRESGARYRVGLVAGLAPIRDADGLQLGTGANGDLAGYPKAGQRVHGAFLTDSFPKQLPAGADASARWAATHRTTADFTVLPDAVPPNLVGVSAYDDGADAVISLRFSEPMTTFDGTPDGWSDPTVLGRVTGGTKIDDPGLMKRYTFRLSALANDVDRARLNGRGANEPVFDPRKDAAAPMGVEFALMPTAVRFDGGLAQAAPGEVVLAVGPVDPHVVTFSFKGRAGLFAGAGAIGARAAGVADPAGNGVSEEEADRHTVSTALKPR